MGTYKRALGLGRGLVKQGHNVTLIASMHERGIFRRLERDDFGVKIVLFPRIFRGPLGAGYDIFETLYRMAYVLLSVDVRAGVVHSFECRPSTIYPSLLLKVFRGFALFIDQCDDLVAAANARAEGSLVRGSIAAVENFFYARYMKSAIGNTFINQHLMRMAPIASKTPRLILDNGKEDEVKASMLGDPAPPHCPLVLVHIGAIFHRDATNLAKALSILNTSSAQFKAYLIGSAWLKYKPLFLDIPSVKITGYLDERELRQVYQRADIGLLPLFESEANRGRSPIKFFEYLRNRICVLATVNFDSAELLQDFGCGVVVEAKALEFANAIRDLMNDRDALSSYKSNSQLLEEALPTWDVLSGLLERFYLECTQ